MNTQTFALPDYGYIPEYLLPENLEKAAVVLSKVDKRTSPGLAYSEAQANTVANLTCLGMSTDDIGATLRIDPKIINVLYEYEIKTATARVNAGVAKTALGMALSGSDPDMTKFWLKTRAGWVETKRIEHTGVDGGPMEFAEVKQSILQRIQEEIELTQQADGTFASPSDSAESNMAKPKRIEDIRDLKTESKDARRDDEREGKVRPNPARQTTGPAAEHVR